MFGLGLGLGIHRHSSANPYAFPFISRVESDGGAIRDKAALLNLTYYLQSMMPNTKLLYCPELGVKLRTSGVNNYVTKLYDISSNMLDGTQTTALNQPYLSGNIAPNEKYAIKNNAGTDLNIKHTQIVFSNTDKWSISTVINMNKYGKNIWYIGKDKYSLVFLFGISSGNVPYLYVDGAVYAGTKRFDRFFGKNTVITLTANGDNILNIYVNGNFFDVLTAPTNATISIFGTSYDPYMAINGTISYHCIRDTALSPTQVQDEYTYLRSIFPEIESVQIGTQTWATSNCEMTCTPQGNVIQETQAAINVEKITNAADREFSSDTGFWGKTSGVTISNGICNIKTIDESPQGITKPLLTVGKYYKFTYDIVENRGGSLRLQSTPTMVLLDSTVGVNKYAYIKATDNLIQIVRHATSTDIDIDNISIQEVGWSDSTNLYNYVYANTSGTAEQKEYAAVKAAAMWCYYGNDPTLGAVYGKLYNWYAVKLLQMDIDYYNAANPTATWGWRVPTSDDFNLLSTYLGGDEVSGSKIKKEGFNYWDTPNTGVDNSSWFSAIGSGYRNGLGTYGDLKISALLRTTSDYRFGIRSNTIAIDKNGTSNSVGASLRLIKA